jgi:4-amino-4-deoxy-L-arabinose transferase-like glycosyltransferase
MACPFDDSVATIKCAPFDARGGCCDSSATVTRPLALFAALVLLAVAGYVRWTPPARAGDLRPRPDALEYEAGARSMVRGTGYYVVVEGRRYAPRYPPGFPVLLAPVVFAWDQGPGTGIVVVFVAALLGIAFLVRATSLTAGPVAGLVAGTLLAASPCHVRWSRTVMTEVPSATFVALAALLLVRAVRVRATTALLVAIGVLIGLATCVRVANGLLLVPATLVVLTLGGGARRATIVLGAALAGMVPLLLYDLATFGHPFATGYERWAPTNTFAVSHLWTQVGGGKIPNLRFYGGMLAGSGELYPWPWTLLIMLGGLCAIRSVRPAERAIGIFAGSFLVVLAGVFSLFSWQDSRYLLPALPALFGVGTLPLAAHRGRASRLIAAGLVIAGLVVLARRPDLYDPDKFFNEPGVLRELAVKTPKDATILVRTNEHFFALLLRNDADRTWVPRRGARRACRRGRG